jgi:aminoglycoside N3'-acetyltransferase
VTSLVNRGRIGLHAGRSLLAERVSDRRRRVGPVPDGTFTDLFAAHAADAVFVHAGLSAVNAAFAGNPYEHLFDALTAQYDNLLVPGFTPSFLDAGVYHRTYSRPEFGTFARLFRSDAAYRTADPVYSILVHGEFRFETCDHGRSFAPAGCFGKLDRENVLFVNVGTSGFRCSHLHYLEQRHDVPYVTVSDHDGIVYHTDTSFERVSHSCPTDDLSRRFNRAKLERRLSDAGVLDRYDRNGLTVRFCRARDLRTVLDDHLSADPYYLVT